MRDKHRDVVWNVGRLASIVTKTKRFTPDLTWRWHLWLDIIKSDSWPSLRVRQTLKTVAKIVRTVDFQNGRKDVFLISKKGTKTTSRINLEVKRHYKLEVEVYRFFFNY